MSKNIASKISPATVAAALATADLSTLDGCASFVDAVLGAGAAAKVRAQKKSLRGRANELAALAPATEQLDSDEVRVTAAPVVEPVVEEPVVVPPVIAAQVEEAHAFVEAQAEEAPAAQAVVDAATLAEIEEYVLAVAPAGTVGGRVSRFAGADVAFIDGVDPSEDDYYLNLAARGQKRSWWSARVGILFSRRAKTLANAAGISLPSLPWRSDAMQSWAETALEALAGYRQN